MTQQGLQKEAQGIEHPLYPRLLPIKKAAEALGLTVWGLRQRVWAGDIPVVRFGTGGKQYIDRKDLDKLVEQNKERMI